MILIPESHFSCSLKNFDWKGKEKLKDLLYVWLNRGDKSLFIYGPPGVGKTHLLVGLFKDLIKRGYVIGSDVMYIQFSDLVEESYKGLGLGVMVESIIDRVTGCRFLLVDDIRKTRSDWWKTLVKLLIEGVYSSPETFCVFTTNANSEKDLFRYLELEDYYVSRLVSEFRFVLLKGRDRRQDG